MLAQSCKHGTHAGGDKSLDEYGQLAGSLSGIRSGCRG